MASIPALSKTVTAPRRTSSMPPTARTRRQSRAAIPSTRCATASVTSRRCQPRSPRSLHGRRSSRRAQPWRRTAPDQSAVHGVLRGGAVASIHVQGGTCKATGVWLEINGTKGDLVVSGPGSVQVGPLVLRGARKKDGAGASLAEIPVPASYDLTDGAVPAGPPPFNVAQQYRSLARSIRDGIAYDPDFDTAVERHELLDFISDSALKGVRGLRGTGGPV